MTLLKDYHHFNGLGWSIAALVNALAYQGVTAPHTGQPYSEALLQGISGGICAGYFAFEYEGHPPHIHVLTRYPFNDDLPPAVYERLAIPQQIQHTTNPDKAAANILNALARGKPAIVWADAASIPYNAMPTEDNWLVMPLLVYGYDLSTGQVAIADRACVGLTVPVEAFSAARGRIAKTKYRMATVDAPDAKRLPAAVKAGIHAALAMFTFEGDTPNFVQKARGSFGFNGLEKWAKLLEDKKGRESWAVKFAPGPRMFEGLLSGFQSLDVWYTGGRGARDLFADFLDEADVILSRSALREAATLFRVSAQKWGDLSAALLPEGVAPLRETRELLLRQYDLFRTTGGASTAERWTIADRLNAIRADMALHFPLNEAEAAALRGEIRARVLALLDAERAAVGSLQEIMRSA